jgi:histidinol-phosphate aminotransferase
LRQKGIAVRRFAAPAYKEYIRITIGRPVELRAAVNTIRDFLSGGTQ